MSPDSKVYGRVTIGGNRVSIGHASVSVMLIRAGQEIQKAKHRAEMVIQIELSPTRLLDATTFDKAAKIEHELSTHFITNPDEDSGFPGVTIRRLTEAMDSPEYKAYAEICDPEKRMSLNEEFIQDTIQAFEVRFPDCFQYFPKWVD